MNLACPKCRTFYRIRKTGVYWEEGMPTTSEPGAPWQAYKLWAGDLKECKCGAQVILGPPGGFPIGEHYQPDYAERVERHGPIVRIDDCDGQWHEADPPNGRIVVHPERMWTEHRIDIEKGGVTFILPATVGDDRMELHVKAIDRGSEGNFVHLCRRIVMAVGDGYPFGPKEPPKI